MQLFYIDTMIYQLCIDKHMFTIPGSLLPQQLPAGTLHLPMACQSPKSQPMSDCVPCVPGGHRPSHSYKRHYFQPYSSDHTTHKASIPGALIALWTEKLPMSPFYFRLTFLVFWEGLEGNKSPPKTATEGTLSRF